MSSKTFESATIAIVGVGGLGVPAIEQLARGWSGEGLLTLRVIDFDTVAASNLNRQVAFTTSSIGRAKVDVLAEYIARTHSEKNIRIKAICEKLSRDNIASYLLGADYVIDGTDSTKVKFLLSDFCSLKAIPLCYGGVSAITGLALEIAPAATHAPCLRCLFGDFTEEDYLSQEATCQRSGILGPVAGIIGGLQASLALRFLQGKQSESPTLFRLNEKLEITSSRLSPSPDCPLSGITQPIPTFDFSDLCCPSTFLYTKLALENASPDSIIECFYDNEESVETVTRSVEEQGHIVISKSCENGKNGMRLIIRKSAGEPLMEGLQC